ncbi:MAG: ABC transporter ATP-binding protein [Actinobacteria bacterium]|nr:MAG: ABC transporter ATP-binding protein [Actinomycetota bacterium]
MSNFIEIKNIKKSYDFGKIKALDGVNLDITKGEYISIMGPSGSGKSTLLNMIGGLDKPDQGQIIVGGTNITKKRDLTNYRAQKIGFIFQLHNLLPSQTTLENVIAPMYESKLRSKKRRERASELLNLVGLRKRNTSYPTQLSGGERQRVAIARALANSPEIILADEPTGSLDSKSSDMIMDLLAEIWSEEKRTLIVITHEEVIGKRAERIVTMLDGKVESQKS